MRIAELRVPSLGESVTEVEVGAWHVAEGDTVGRDEVVVELESEKASVELPAPETGVLRAIHKRMGEKASVGEVIGWIEVAVAASEQGLETGAAAAAPEPVASERLAPAPEPVAPSRDPVLMPAARRVLGEAGVEPGAATPTGPGGRLLKEDAERAVAARAEGSPAASAPGVAAGVAAAPPSRGERVVRASVMRRTIAARLAEAQRTMALLTTFNEADLSAVLELRQRFGASFHERHGTKLGLMSFFVRSVTAALRAIPEVNAALRGEEIVYHDYCDIGIAVGSDRGLVVPVLRSAEHLSFAEIERQIGDFAGRARAGTLRLDELQGGTFSISNGGIYGSLLSTPIVNPPQSAILGLHTIQERPVAVEGQVVIRPMMYLALTYDHRLIDGREAVTFLKQVKQGVEQPQRLLLEV